MAAYRLDDPNFEQTTCQPFITYGRFEDGEHPVRRRL